MTGEASSIRAEQRRPCCTRTPANKPPSASQSSPRASPRVLDRRLSMKALAKEPHGPPRRAHGQLVDTGQPCAGRGRYRKSSAHRRALAEARAYRRPLPTRRFALRAAAAAFPPDGSCPWVAGTADGGRRRWLSMVERAPHRRLGLRPSRSFPRRFQDAQVARKRSEGKPGEDTGLPRPGGPRPTSPQCTIAQVGTARKPRWSCPRTV